MKPLRLLLLFILCHISILSGQELSLKKFDINNGLSNNSVVTIFQDNDEFMWFGTYDGLNRFDGYNFKVYRNIIGDSTSLSGNTVYTIAADSDNNLWVGGARGASIMNKQAETFSSLFYKTAAGKKMPLADIVHQIKPGCNNAMLVGTQKSGVILYSDGNTGRQIPLIKNGKKIYAYDAIAIEQVHGKKCAWVAVRDVGICKLNAQKQQLEVYYPAAFKIYSLLVSGENGLWLGTDSGLYLLDTQKGLLGENRLPGKNIVTSILKDNKGKMWLATDGRAIYTYNTADALATPYSHAKGPISKSNSFFSIYQDKKHNLWFGTLRAGISLLGNDKQRFEHVLCVKDARDNVPDNFVLSFCEADKGNLWIGTDGSGLKYWDRAANTFKDYNTTNSSLSSNFITGLVKGKDAELWISAWYGGVDRMDTKTGKLQHFDCINPEAGQVEKNAWLVFKDRDNTIWVSTTNEGSLYRFDEQKKAFVLFNNEVKNLQCLTQTADGKLWGGNYTTLYSMDIASKSYKKHELGYPVRSVLEDKSGNFWVGTQEGGLLLFDRKNGTYKRFTTTEGLPGNTILRLLEDYKGNLWMSTYNGLSRFDKESLFKNFSISDGLQSSQFSFNAGIKLSTGEMAFGGINGFNIFYPKNITNAYNNRVVHLNSVSLNNKPVHNDSQYAKTDTAGLLSLRLPYDQTNLSLDFVSLDYLHPDKITYAYMLEGWDDNWNITDDLRKANYSRIQEGHYTFKVKTKNDDGTWSKTVALASINILPPWYRSWWAYLLYIAVAGGLIYAYQRYNKNKAELKYRVQLAEVESKKERELAEKQLSMFTYISHELRAPLSLIINPLKRAAKSASNENVEMANDLAVANRNARRLLSLVDQLLLFRKAESDADNLTISSINVNSLCEEVYQCFAKQAKGQGVSLKFEASPVNAVIFGDYEKIEIALFNLVSNALKHTPQGGTVKLGINEDNNNVWFTVEDTGSGISDANLPTIFEKYKQVNKKPSSASGFGIGLFLVKYFTEKHGGSVSCSSTVGVGSAFTLNFIKGYDHFADMPISSVSPKMSELVEELLADKLDETVTAEPEKPQLALSDEIITHKKAVLVVEDNHQIRDYLVKLLKQNYIVYTAENGNEAVEKIKVKMPDLVVSDITMEGMDGLELCRLIKKDSTLCHIPVILLTANSDSETRLQGITDGADDYITKPFDDEILLARIDTLLKGMANLRSYFLDSITLKEQVHKVPVGYEDFLKKCIDIIEANLEDKEFNIKTFSRLMGMSHRSLYDKIKLISGETLNAFIRSVKLRRAAVLMLTGEMNVAQAASQVGFEDPQYFRQQFVKLFGITPSEYIKKYKATFSADMNIIRK